MKHAPTVMPIAKPKNELSSCDMVVATCQIPLIVLPKANLTLSTTSTSANVQNNSAAKA